MYVIGTITTNILGYKLAYWQLVWQRRDVIDILSTMFNFLFFLSLSCRNITFNIFLPMIYWLYGIRGESRWSSPNLSALNTFEIDSKIIETIYCGVCCCAGVVLGILDAMRQIWQMKSPITMHKYAKDPSISLFRGCA